PNVIEYLHTKKVSIVEACQSIQFMQGTEEEESAEEGHEGHNHSHELDPQVWLDPVIAQKEVTAIRDAVIKKDPEKKA
ncbi:metal ABC transporter solute-binding protein, Zn/Mn family, partial [Enterococcus faecalis]|uniref:metal ABC transporter solute-binding protein, Zn/Mn family n=1 Tax=Enterococcus faecalis TaxID=1351 RepID=UPI003D6A50CE